MSEERAAREGQVIMPFYIICDVSGSMYNDMAALNDGLAQLRQDIMKDPVVDDLVMLSVITFDDSARTVVPLTAPTDVELPRLGPGGGTTYGTAFREFHRAFEEDRKRLKGEGKRVFRPCIFFLSDGEPQDRDYLQTFQSLLGYDPTTKQGNSAYPYVTTFGFRDASQHTMEAIAYPNFGESNKRGRWFLAKNGQAVGELLKSMAGVIGQSVLKSGQSVGTGAPQYVAPTSVAGMEGSFV
ncbi:VWA domain-containing protein [Frankia sp. Cj3]|uniref:vWA domain-containing protein n=1 Tax=Frankia sp. Cj3 TaxID=2880976 RepID=UPI001EF626B5|nr:VWA domain-containing protein [Frankia sp. Cj3]